MYKEGDPSNFVYIVWKGEFAVTKRVKNEKELELDIQAFIGPSSGENIEELPNMIENSKKERSNSPNKKFKDKGKAQAV